MGYAISRCQFAQCGASSPISSQARNFSITQLAVPAYRVALSNERAGGVAGQTTPSGKQL
jgi:hypothetical protein